MLNIYLRAHAVNEIILLKRLVCILMYVVK